MKKKTFVWLMTWLSFHVSAQISDAPAAVINHAQSIRQGGFSHDGRLFLTASADLTIKVWEVLTGRLLKTLSGHHGGVNTAEFSQDDKQIVSASEDSTARIWSTLSAATIHILFSPEGPVRTAVFSPDGLQVATASADQINIWNGVTGTFNGTILDLADNKEMSLQFQPERPKDAASLINQGAAIWDVDSGNIISTEYGYDNQGLYVGPARFSPNGNHIVSTHGRDAKIWDDGETISLTGHKRYIYFSCFSPNGNLVATASDDGTAKLWEATTGKLMATLPHAHDVLHVDFSPDSKLLATACADFSAQIWQVQPTKLLTNYRHIVTMSFLRNLVLMESCWQQSPMITQ